LDDNDDDDDDDDDDFILNVQLRIVQETVTETSGLLLRVG